MDLAAVNFTLLLLAAGARARPLREALGEGKHSATPRGMQQRLSRSLRPGQANEAI